MTDILTNAIESYEIYITAFASILVAIIIIYKKGIRPILKHFKNWYLMIDKIDKIFEEITPNGGTSIKDIIDIIEYKVDIVSERQKSMLHENDAALVETDEEGEVIWVNRTCTRLVQRDASELMKTGWVNVVTSEDRDRVIEEWHEAVKDKREINIYFSLETPGGNKIPVKTRSYVLRNPKDKLLGFLASIETLN